MSASTHQPGLVTGDAVELEVPQAGLGLRVIARVIDAVIEVGLLVVEGYVMSKYLDVSVALGSALVVLALAGTLVGWPVLWETFCGGRTPGKFALGTRAVRVDGGPIRFRQALARGLMGMVEIWSLSGLPAVISALASSRGQRLGDHLAGTQVVRERTSAPHTTPVQMPPALAGWAAGADLGTIPAPLLVSARRFLRDGSRYTPQAQGEVARLLLADLFVHVQPVPPPAPAYAVIAAVLAEHRRRAEKRLAEDERVRQRVLPQR